MSVLQRSSEWQRRKKFQERLHVRVCLGVATDKRLQSRTGLIDVCHLRPADAPGHELRPQTRRGREVGFICLGISQNRLHFSQS